MPDMLITKRPNNTTNSRLISVPEQTVDQLINSKFQEYIKSFSLTFSRISFVILIKKGESCSKKIK